MSYNLDNTMLLVWKSEDTEKGLPIYSYVFVPKTLVETPEKLLSMVDHIDDKELPEVNDNLGYTDVFSNKEDIVKFLYDNKSSLRYYIWDTINVFDDNTLKIIEECTDCIDKKLTYKTVLFFEYLQLN